MSRLGLFSGFMPNEYVYSIYDIDLERLWRIGKRLILTDLDNTLVPWNHPSVPKSLEDWLKRARDRGFEVCIVSNNRSQRVNDFAYVSGLRAVGAARKPKADGFRQAMEWFHMDADSTVMVGDQLFTDIHGANRLGLYSILVLPMHHNEWWGTKLMRVFEGVALTALRVRGLKRPQGSRKGGGGFAN